MPKAHIFVINFFTNRQWNFEAIGKIGQIDLEPVDIQSAAWTAVLKPELFNSKNIYNYYTFEILTRI